MGQPSSVSGKSGLGRSRESGRKCVPFFGDQDSFMTRKNGLYVIWLLLTNMYRAWLKGRLQVA